MSKFTFLILFSIICFSLKGQDSRDYSPPTNLRHNSEHLYRQVDLLWTPPTGWAPSRVDRWYDWDRGIWEGNALGSCFDCPAEAAARWDNEQISMYDSVYLTRIRYILLEPEINYRLRVYQGTPESFDTLLNYPLTDSIVYDIFDTLNIDPILLDLSKDLWLGYWVHSMAYGYPLPLGEVPAVDGYGNMLQFYSPDGWVPLTTINPDIDFPWSIGGYLETPNDSIIYPLFNIYRSVDAQPFELLNQLPFLDTVYYDFIRDLDPSHLYYYVTSVYEDGESEPSDTLHISFVNTQEIKIQKVNIFPNPATEKVTIESGQGKIKSVSLLNLNGDILFEKIMNDERVDIDIEGVHSSLYLIKIITGEGVYTSKIIIQN